MFIRLCWDLVGILDSRNRSLLCAVSASLHPPDWAGPRMESHLPGKGHKELPGTERV